MSATVGIGFELENQHCKYVVGANGKNLHLIDKRSGKDYCDPEGAPFFASIKKSGREYTTSSISATDGKLNLDFADAGVTAVISAESHPEHFTFEVISVSGEDVEELTFANARLVTEGGLDAPFVCCSLALNLKTNVTDIPGANNRTGAMCYPRFGFEGARVAVIACPPEEMRRIMQDVITASPELPQSPLGGPWAQDAEINRGSYLFNFDGVSEETVDDWIKLTLDLGMNQIDFHGGESFRFGDCRPNPERYPNGRASLKAVIDKLHAAGIKAGLHTYAFFIDKECPWVTPVPDPGLGKDAFFTLAESIDADADIVPVVESTDRMSTITGFFERNSVTVQIDDELIDFADISKTPPYAFTKCTRGAHGTKPAPHAKGAKVGHLTEVFGLFAPGGDSELLAEVAAATADMYDECGFDMMYLDALDGEDILGGRENSWHYGSKFVFELHKRLKKPALIEMSTFHHHLWYVRSRIGAMDYPARSQKAFIDIHCTGNERATHCVGMREADKMFMPAELGWWSLFVAGNPQVERTFPDDIEYLMCKGLATNTGFALMGIKPETLESSPAYQALAPIFKNYETLRHAGYFSESAREKLKQPGAEHKLEQVSETDWQLRPIDYAKHKVEALDGISNRWTTVNKFGRQPLRLRIEALISSQPYNSPDGVIMTDFTNPADFANREFQSGVTADLRVSNEQVKVGSVSGCLTAINSRDSRDGAWSKIGTVFNPYLDLSNQQAVGVWVHGDGKGEVLNVQIKSPEHLAHGFGDHLIPIDFTGWRYFELIEPSGAQVHDYIWPYGNHIYGVYREQVEYQHVEFLSLWYNNLPAGEEVTCHISAIKALPLVNNPLRNPKLTVNGKTITFPVEVESYSYLEFHSLEDCKVYGPNGELIAEVIPEGDIPTLQSGENTVEFTCETMHGINARAYVTVITQGDEVIR